MGINELCIPAGWFALNVCTLDGYTSVTFDADVVGPWVCQRAGGQYLPGKFSAIGRVKDGELIAGVLYEDTNGVNVFCHIAGEGRWANRHFLWLIFDYPFRQLGVSRITTVVEPQNTVSQEFTKRLGFEVETKLKDSHPQGDLWVFRMFKRDCPWLEKKS